MVEGKFSLANGVCSKRFSCKNLDNKECNLTPKKNENYIYCKNYEKK